MKNLILCITYLTCFYVSAKNSDSTKYINKVIIFPNGYEIFVNDNGSSSSFKKIYKIEGENYFFDFDSVKIENGKIYVIERNVFESRMKYKKGGLLYQEGIIRKKFKSIDSLGNYILLKEQIIKSMNDSVLEVFEKDKDGQINMYQMTNLIQQKIGNFVRANYYEVSGKKISIEKDGLFLKNEFSAKQRLIEFTEVCNPKIACGFYDPFINKKGTKGLCSYYPKVNRRNKEKNCILEVNLNNGSIIRYSEIYGRNPTLSEDDKQILLSYLHRKNYYIFKIKEKNIIKLPECKYAIWWTQ